MLMSFFIMFVLFVLTTVLYKCLLLAACKQKLHAGFAGLPQRPQIIAVRFVRVCVPAKLVSDTICGFAAAHNPPHQHFDRGPSLYLDNEHMGMICSCRRSDSRRQGLWQEQGAPSLPLASLQKAGIPNHF
jgi:hypothetical protein